MTKNEIKRTLDQIQRELQNISKKLDMLTHIIDFGLPNSNRWKWVPVKIINRVILPGDRVELYDHKGSGYIYYFMATMNSPDLRFHIDVGADNRLEIDISPRDLYNMGLTGTHQGYFQVTAWKPDQNFYAIGYSPIGLGVPFTGSNRAEVVNPTSSPVVIYYLIAWLLMTRW